MIYRVKDFLKDQVLMGDWIVGKKIIYILLFVLLFFVVFPIASYAESYSNQITDTSITIQTSIYSRHWNNNNRYNNNQNLFGLEYQRLNKKILGIALFQNSFNQSCYYVYTGKKYHLRNIAPEFKVYGKLTTGIVHGYDDENGRYEGSLNELKTFPAIVPGIELEYKAFTVSLIIYSNAGYMFTSGIKF